MRTRIICIALTVALTLSGCSVAPERLSWSGFHFDTHLSISYYGTELQQDDIAQIVNRVDRDLGKSYADGDLISYGEHVAEVPNYLAYLVERTGYYYRLSGGLFDITIGAVSALWDFKSDAPVLPDAAEIAAALEKVGYAQIERDATGRIGQKEGMVLDFGGIAKGYAADLIAEALLPDMTGAIIDFGGDCLAVGEKPDGLPWRIGIRDPFDDKGGVAGHVEVRGKAVATSGLYERYFELDGVRYHHILDPRNGYPCETDIMSATVIADSACDADALATICIMLGSTDALNLVGDLDGVECVLILTNGTVLTSESANFSPS